MLSILGIIAIALLTSVVVCVIFMIGISNQKDRIIRLSFDPIVLKISPERLENPLDIVLDAPMPEQLMLYIEQESDEWAKSSRKARARTLFAELSDWDAVHRILRKEDEIS